MRVLALVAWLLGCAGTIAPRQETSREPSRETPQEASSEVATEGQGHDSQDAREAAAHATTTASSSVESSEAASSRFAVRVRMRDGQLTVVARGSGASWRAPEGTIEARDADGPLGTTRATDGRLVLARAPHGVVEVTLRRTLPPGRCAYLAPGSIPHPDDDTPRATQLSIDAEGSVATTLGPGAAHEAVALPSQLASVAVLAGALDEARFATRLGRDTLHGCTEHADVRWTAAELATMRTRIDAWMGGLDAEPLHVLVHDASTLSVARSGRGLVVALADAWDAEARLAVAHVLARRWIGGWLRFEGDERWATLGLARWVAITRLTEMGLLSAEELAAELTRHEAAVALFDAHEDVASLGRSTLFAFDVAARRGPGDASLRTSLLAWLALAEEHGAPVPRERLWADHPDDGAAFAWGAGDAPIARIRSAGPCVRRAPGVHRRFAWGFDAPEDRAGSVVVRGLVEGGAAARAGLREGDVIEALQGDPRHPERPITARRGAQTLRWPAFDRERRGHVWRVVSGVDPSRCAEPR